MNKMKLIYMFTSDGCASPEAVVKWDRNAQAENHFLNQLAESEGFFYMIQRMIEEKTIEACDIYVDTMRGHHGWLQMGAGIRGFAIPHVMDIQYEPEDVFLVRGGFKPWYPFLTELFKKRENWILFYRANTDRGRWPFWDVTLDDLSARAYVAGDSLRIAFKKPTSPLVFSYKNTNSRKFDVCVGASHIHDRKGQWRVVKAASLLRSKKIELKLIMPGRSIGGFQTLEMFRQIEREKLDIVMPGMVPRFEVANILNKTKLFVNMGSGQNDRGVLEAMCCGAPVMVAQPRYFSSFVQQCPTTSVCRDSDNIELLAEDIAAAVHSYTAEKSEETVAWHERHCGMRVVLDQMRFLFQILRRSPMPSRPYVIKEWGL